MKITPNNITSLSQLMNTIKSEDEDKRTIVEKMINKKDEDEEEENESTSNARAVKTMKRNIEMEKIASKIARGKGIGIDEEKYVLKHNPGLLNKARMINSERKLLEEKIRLCKTKEEADNLVHMYKYKGIVLSFSNNIEEPNIGKVILSSADILDGDTVNNRKDKEKKEKEDKDKRLGKIDLLV